MERYVLRGGRWGYDRLRILARVRRAETLALLGRAGVGPGQRCVDLGSGSGEVSFELARLTGPDGSVTGIDMDEVKLALARGAAAERAWPTSSSAWRTSTTGPNPVPMTWCTPGSCSST